MGQLRLENGNDLEVIAHPARSTLPGRFYVGSEKRVA